MENWQARLAAGDKSLHIHLIGLGGAGLSAVATVLLELGMQVSGSDRQANAHTARLAAAGAHIFTTQSADNLAHLDRMPDVVLISSAVDAENAERRAAEAQGLPVVKRGEFLGALLAQRKLIAVAGTHGKSTTTSMIVKALREASINAGYIIGADLPGYGNGAAGAAPEFVIEADEYDHMFLGLTPTVAVITNVEWDHPDCYPTPASFRRAFMQFVDKVPRDGLVISCADDAGAAQLHAYQYTRGAQWITYGEAESADLRVEATRATERGGAAADLVWQHAPVGTLELEVPGVHNLLNALAALGAATWCGAPLPGALDSLRTFRGVGRRFEQKGEAAGVIIIDDYAHHPTEIAATLAAARLRYPDRRIWAVFQPHTFSRTQRMLYRMGDSFQHADEVIVTDIYAAREQDDGSVSAAELVAASEHPHIRHIARLSEAAAHLAGAVQPGDVVVTLGAGDSYKVGEMLLAQLREGVA